MGIPAPIHVEAEASGNSYSCICCNREPRVVYVVDKRNPENSGFQTKETPRFYQEKQAKKENKRTWTEVKNYLEDTYPGININEIFQGVVNCPFDACKKEGRHLPPNLFNLFMETAYEDATERFSMRVTAKSRVGFDTTTEGRDSAFISDAAMSPRILH